MPWVRPTIWRVDRGRIGARQRRDLRLYLPSREALAVGLGSVLAQRTRATTPKWCRTARRFATLQDGVFVASREKPDEEVERVRVRERLATRDGLWSSAHQDPFHRYFEDLP